MKLENYDKLENGSYGTSTVIEYTENGEDGDISNVGDIFGVKKDIESKLKTLNEQIININEAKKSLKQDFEIVEKKLFDFYSCRKNSIDG